VPPGSVFSHLPGGRRLADRYHNELADALVSAPNARMLGFELQQRLLKRSGWRQIIERNRLFQHQAIAALRNSETPPSETPTLFSYSYAAADLFKYAKERGWKTVLGQIDPGPEEERIVAEEHQRYAHLGSAWQLAPASYWDSWREEVALADRIIINSEWSRECLLKEGVPAEKMEVVPLVYGERHEGEGGRHEGEGERHEARGMRHEEEGERQGGEGGRQGGAERNAETPKFRNAEIQTLRVLFLGQINLRKGIGRLLDAMRLLKDDSVELILAGPTEIDPAAWVDLPKVRWVGPVPRSEVGQYYQDADAFILPTLSDGYALTQLEALSRGLPVIASKCCGEAVTDGVNGLLLEDLEPATIAAALRRVRTMEFTDVRASGFGLGELAAALVG